MLPPPRHGLSLDDRIRKKRLTCGHEPKSLPIFPPEFCFCENPAKRKAQVSLLERGKRTRDYSDEDSDSSIDGEDFFFGM